MDLPVPNLHYNACSSLLILSRVLSGVLGLEQHRYALQFDYKFNKNCKLCNRLCGLGVGIGACVHTHAFSHTNHSMLSVCFTYMRGTLISLPFIYFHFL